MRAWLERLPARKEEGVGDKRERQQVKQVERADHRAVGLQELPDETLSGIDPDEQVEAGAQNRLVAAPCQGDEHGEKYRHRHRFVELHGMASDAVAEIDTPGQRR